MGIRPGRAVASIACLVTLILLPGTWVIDTVFFQVSAFADAIIATPAALALTAVKGQTASGSFNLQKAGTDQRAYGISASQSWIWTNPPYNSSATISTEVDKIAVTIPTANLPVGTSSGVVYITESGNMLRVPISITVTAGSTTSPPPVTTGSTTSPPPVSSTPTPIGAAGGTPTPPPPPSPPAAPTSLTSYIQAFPAALALTAVKGQTASGSFNLQKAGTDQRAYGISASQSWIWTNPPYNSSATISTEVDKIAVTIPTANLPVGTSSGVVYITESGNMLRVPISITVTAGSTTSPPPVTTGSTVSPPPVSSTPTPIGAAGGTPTPPPPPSPPAAPTSLTSYIQAFPAALALTAVKGQTASGSFNLQKAGTDQRAYGISASQSWIWTNPPYNSSATISTEVDKIAVTVPTANLPVGTSSGVVYITESGNMLRVPISITVTAGSTTSPPPVTTGSTVSPPPVSSTPTPIGAAGGTPTPPPPPSPPASVPSTGTATVTWSANSEADLSGYKVYVGTASGVYSSTIDVANTTSYRITLPKGFTYFFAVSAYDAAGNESQKSGEVSRSIF